MEIEQKSILRTLADNPALFEALKEVLKKHFTDDVSSTTLTNEQLGAITRARVDGLDRLDRAFREIACHQTPEARKISDNPAR